MSLNKHAQTMRISILPEDQEPELIEKEKKAPVKRSARPVVKTAKKDDNPQFRELFQSVYDAAILCGMAGTITDVNVRALEFFLYDKPDFCKLNILDVISGSDQTLITTICENVRVDRFTLIEAYCIRADETVFPAEIAVNMLTLGEQDLLCFFIRDTTLRIEAEQQIKEKNEQLQLYASEMESLAEKRAKQLVHADRMVRLGVMSAGIAHEINNPATFISSNIETLSMFMPEIETALENTDGTDDDTRRKRLFIIEELPKITTGIKTGVERISKIVRSLKTFSRQDDFDRKPCNINECITQSIEMCHAAIKNGIDLETDLAEIMPRIMADSQQLVQIFVNLISNAADAMKTKSEKKLRITSSANETGVQVLIEDSGTGIPKEKLDSIWDPFFTTKPVGEGTGLGLSISHGIIKAHGGTVRAENREEGGARFIIDLPLPE